MLLPHVTLLANFNNQQGICEYDGSYSDIAGQIGLTLPLSSGVTTVTNSNLYAEGSCCGGLCCSCEACGGEIGNTISVGTSNAVGEVQLMLDHLNNVGSKHTGSQSCQCSCPFGDCQQGEFTVQCPPSPSAGTYTPQQGRVDLVRGPFHDSSGRDPEEPTGVAPYISYAMYEQPTSKCGGATLESFLTSIGEDLFGLLTGEAGAAGVAAAVGGTAFIVGIECALS